MLEFIYVFSIIVVVVLLLWKISFFHRFSLSWWWFAVAFLLKVVAGATLVYIYTYYYTDRSKADIYKYFDDGKVMYDALKNNPSHYLRMITGIDNDNPLFDSLYYAKMNNWYRVYETVTYNDSHTMIRLNALFFLVSGGFFSVHSLFFILMSFLGSILLFAAIVKIFPKKDKLLFFSVFAIPSIVFWTSGALKEAVLLLGVGLNLFSLFHFFDSLRLKWLYGLLFLISLFILIFIKMYVLLAIIPMLIAYVWISMTRKRRFFLKYTLSLLGYILLLYIVGKINSDYFFPSLLVQKQHDFIGLALHEKSSSYIEPLPIKPSLLSLTMYAFPALVNAMFQPFIWNISSLLEAFSFFDLLLFYLIIIVLLIYGKIQLKEHTWFFLYFSVIMFLLVGFTTPVVGAIVRYRIPAMLFLLIGVIGSVNLDNTRLKILKNKVQ
ncbi:MAG: hypothetical protein N2Z72_00175 [Bacteroidales bacterium]|nr:hypothetical protein [Bacteroidales bacterium]